ncbi:MAG: T9SS type A sorting domain-containing protein [Saprospiraceae bacterium]|nr:T9SS type A sorting domain-containing protein [Saprospiraceae bacterium]
MRIIYTFILSMVCALTVYAQPTNNAGDPPARDAADVIGIYGDTYTNVGGLNYDPNWGQSGHMLVDPAFDPGTGSTILAYPTFNYQGTEMDASDASSMEFLHVDIWVAPGTDRLVKISPIDNSGVGAGEVLVEVPLTPGSWNSVDLPKSAFADMSWNSVFQMKFDGQFNGDGSANTDPFDVYVDNIYFWKNPTVDGTDASLSDLQVDGMTIEGFGPGIFNYTVTVPEGTTDAPQVSATTTDGNATTNITQAGGVPGDATVDVTSGNGSNMQTYTVSFAFPAATPTTSPDAPTQMAANVISIFSDSYSSVADINYDPNWGQSGHTLVNPMFDPGTGNFALAYPNFNYQGTEFAATDASDMEFLHVDIWVVEGTDRLVKISPIDASGVGPGEVLVEVPITPGSWNSVDLPKSAFTDMSWNSIIQMKFDGQFNGDGSANTTPYDIYLDNIYFYKGGGTTAEEPTTGAPDPTHPESGVISLFSGVYTDVAVDTWNTEWSDATFEDIEVDGNATKLYTALGFNGIETVGSPVDASEMMHINMDIWSPNMNEIKIKLVDFLGDGFAGGNGDTEAELAIAVTQGEWMTLKIPLSDFTDAGMTSFSDMNQIVISSDPFGAGTLYLDNVYFSKMVSSSEDLEGISRISVYPNPVSLDGTLYLSETAKKIEVLSLHGQLVRSANASSIDLREVAAGSYLVRITKLDGEQQISKIVVR